MKRHFAIFARVRLLPPYRTFTRLNEQGAAPKRIQEIMGHSSIKVTFDIYGHLFADAEADQALVAAAERRLFN